MFFSNRLAWPWLTLLELSLAQGLFWLLEYLGGMGGETYRVGVGALSPLQGLTLEDVEGVLGPLGNHLLL